MIKDCVGIGWRSDLAAGILTNLDQIDAVEVIADDYLAAPPRALRALRTLAAQVPVVLHGVSLGLASATVVEQQRLDSIARVVGEVQPAFWSEHLAFVRGGGYEIGHLAAPPRTDATIEGTANNLERAHRTVGARPLVENIATLIDPPASSYGEIAWISHVLETSDCDLLLDLHNLYANAVNFGHDPRALLACIPSQKIAAIHLAGGRWITANGPDGSVHRRLLDDHLHDVPDPVYELLSEVGERVSRPLTVILERDGQYPSMEALLDQVSKARRALARGRNARAAEVVLESSPARVTQWNSNGDLAGRRCWNSAGDTMEAFLAKIFVDSKACSRFLADPSSIASDAPLTSEQCQALEGIDRIGLKMAARSFAKKREQTRVRESAVSWGRRLVNYLWSGD